MKLVRDGWLLAQNGFWLLTRIDGELCFEEIPTYFRGALQDTEDEDYIEVAERAAVSKILQFFPNFWRARSV